MALTADRVKQVALDAGFDLCGITSADPPASHAAFEQWVEEGLHGTMDYLARSVALRADVRSILPEAKSVIALGMNYFQPRPDAPGQPKIARYARGRDYHKVIRARMRQMVRAFHLEVPEALFRPCVDSAPVLERDLAQRAGLGWFGKNTCLINTHRGSWFFLAILLTDKELDQDQPAIGGCGTCRACIDACPTGAIVFHRDRWQVDARSCISYLTIEHRGEIADDLKPKIGDWTFGCDVCQDVCPFNHPRAHQPLRAQLTTIEDFKARTVWPSLTSLIKLTELNQVRASGSSDVRTEFGEVQKLGSPDVRTVLNESTELAELDQVRELGSPDVRTELTDPTWDTLTQGSAVRRATQEGLRRNARINLENQD